MRVAKNLIRLAAERLGYELTSTRRVGVHPWWDMDRIRPLRTWTTVVDVGAHQGETAVEWARRAPRARIHSFEPLRDNYARLVENTRHLSAVTCVHAAVGSAPGQLPLYAGSWSQTNSLVPTPDAEVAEVVRVTTLDDVVEREGITRIELLKTDTEGFEIEVLRGAHRTLAAGRVDFIFAEVGFDATDERHTEFGALAQIVDAWGYRLLGLYDLVHWPEPWRIGYCNALFTRC